MAAACAWHVPRDSVSWHVTFSWQRCSCCSVSDHWEHLSQQVTCPLYADCGDPALTPVLRNRVISSSREAPCKLCVIRCWMFPSAGPDSAADDSRRGGERGQPRQYRQYLLPALLLFADSEKLQRKPSNHEVRDHYTLGTQLHTSLGVSSNCKPWITQHISWG